MCDFACFGAILHDLKCFELLLNLNVHILIRSVMAVLL